MLRKIGENHKIQALLAIHLADFVIAFSPSRFNSSGMFLKQKPLFNVTKTCIVRITHSK